jgi:hypothetical protein
VMIRTPKRKPAKLKLELVGTIDQFVALREFLTDALDGYDLKQLGYKRNEARWIEKLAADVKALTEANT